MMESDKALFGYSAGCIVAILLVFAAAIFAVAAALKWVLN